MWNCYTPPVFAPPPRWNLVYRNLESLWLSLRWWKNFEDMFGRSDTISDRDRRTETPCYSKNAPCIASRGKKWRHFCRLNMVFDCWSRSVSTGRCPVLSCPTFCPLVRAWDMTWIQASVSSLKRIRGNRQSWDNGTATHYAVSYELQSINQSIKRVVRGPLRRVDHQSRPSLRISPKTGKTRVFFTENEAF